MKSYTILIVFLFVNAFSFAQVDFKQVIPPNPNVASLFKSTMTPVNDYSGLPNVSIPLYAVTEGNISMPISLSYNTSGIKVSEESGIVGLGWALNIGGTITRSVNGNDDFASNPEGYLNHNKQHPDPPGNVNNYFDPDASGIIDSDSQCRFLVNTTPTTFDMTPLPYHQDYDFMPDTFYYNFNGYSGSFVLDTDGNAVLMKKEGLDIQVDTSSGLSQAVYFTITTADGTVYEFNKTEFTSFSGSTVYTPGYTSSWHLSKITDISGNYIDLIYENKGFRVPFRSFTQTYDIPASFTSQGRNDPTPPGYLSPPFYKEYAGPYTSIEGIYLSEIQFNTGKVKLEYSAEGIRADFDGYYLNSLQVIDNSNDIIKKHDFNYSYFGNPNASAGTLAGGDYGGSINSGSNEFPDFNLRLRLDAVTEDLIKTHEFDYFGSPNAVPNKTTLSQDYWGYYNGAVNRDSFIPYINTNPGVSANSVISQFTEANRLPFIDYTKIFSLKKITYPTKGATEFEYESNTFDEVNIQTITVPRSAQAKADEDAGPPVTDTEIITPVYAQNKPLKIEVSISLFGWDTNLSPTKPNLQGYQITDMFRLKFKRSDGSLIREYFFPSNDAQTQWNNSSAGYIGYQIDELWGTASNPLTGNEFIIEAFFDDQDGLLRGQASITARWEETQVSGQHYSVGGGLRVHSISDFGNDGVLESKRMLNYHYTDAQGNERSYGKLKTSRPRYATSHKLTYFGRTVGGSGTILSEHNPITLGKATSTNTFSKDAGSYVGYDQVETFYAGPEGDNGKKVSMFYNTEDLFRAFNAIPFIDDYHNFPPVRVPHNGLNYLTQNYKRVGNAYEIVSQIENEYTINGFSASNFDLTKLYQNNDYVIGASKENYILFPANGPFDCSNFQFQLHPYYSNWIRQTEVKETRYDLNEQNPVTTVQQFAYENDTHLQRTKTTTIESDGSVLETKVYYPDDIQGANTLAEGGPLANYTYIAQLKADAQHHIATPVQMVTKRNNKLLAIQRTEFGAYGQFVSPRSGLNVDILLPSKTQTSKGATALEDRLLYEDYIKGKPIQLRKEGGAYISYIWGYNNTYPIAKIENASYGEIAAALGITLAQLKTFDEGDLGQINGLRNSHPEFMVTTFTFDPLVGIVTATDNRGYTMNYEYDSLERLKTVKDDKNYIVSDYDYHYKGQN